MGPAARLGLAQVADAVHELQLVFGCGKVRGERLTNAVFQVFDSEGAEVALEEGRVLVHEGLDAEEEGGLGDSVPVGVGEGAEVLADLLGA